MRTTTLTATRTLAILAAMLAMAGCQRQTELASNKNAKGSITVAAAPPKSQLPELPPEALADIAAQQGEAPPTATDGATSLSDVPGYTPMSGPVTARDYRASIAPDIEALPAVSDAAALAEAYLTWRGRAEISPGAYEDGQVQLGADPKEYRPSDAELLAAEAGDRLSAALQGANDAAKAAVAAIVGEKKTYRRFDYRHVDVMGSGRYFYASAPRDAALPL